MQESNKILSIAGFDPSGGAGVLADVKTAEQLKVYVMAIITANTLQTEDAFFDLQWQPIQTVENSISTLMNRYDFSVVKIGIVPNVNYLHKIVSKIKQLQPQCKIVWDTVLKASAGVDFFATETLELLPKTLEMIDLITPNFEEYQVLKNYLSPRNTVLIKGGHRTEQLGTDSLIFKNQIIDFPPNVATVYPKHGSGCVLSSAITAYLAQEKSLEESCRLGKQYVEKFLNSNASLLGKHNENQ